ncbi:MAG TPA: metal ABC transporter ATP-binding protein [Thermomicrobiales bacterium]|nr:metal ABC transporter ATP-binding protein [Thermomicrobiales bacterium]
MDEPLPHNTPALDRRPEAGDHPVRLVTHELSVHFEDRSALECVSLAFRAGQTTSLLGPNGAGKSTLLRVLAGMLPPTHGFVRLDGRPLRRADQDIVYVPQRTSVDWTFPVSVIEVVLMARANQRSRWLPFASADRKLAEEALDDVGMRRYANVQIGALSGGQQQRVFLARALVEAGDVYLLDEPFAGVDIPTQELLINLFDQLRRDGKTIVYATHDLAQAAHSSDQIVLLNRQLIASGPPRAVMTAANLRATFGGQAIVPLDLTTGIAAQ